MAAVLLIVWPEPFRRSAPCSLDDRRFLAGLGDLLFDFDMGWVLLEALGYPAPRITESPDCAGLTLAPIYRPGAPPCMLALGEKSSAVIKS